jgi:hypothetical protein
MEIDRRILTHFKIDRLLRLRKSVTVDRERVCAWLQTVNFIEPRRIRNDLAFRSGADFYRLDVRK